MFGTQPTQPGIKGGDRGVLLLPEHHYWYLEHLSEDLFKRRELKCWDVNHAGALWPVLEFPLPNLLTFRTPRVKIGLSRSPVCCWLVLLHVSGRTSAPQPFRCVLAGFLQLWTFVSIQKWCLQRVCGCQILPDTQAQERASTLGQTMTKTSLLALICSLINTLDSPTKWILLIEDF